MAATITSLDQHRGHGGFLRRLRGGPARRSLSTLDQDLLRRHVRGVALGDERPLPVTMVVRDSSGVV